MEQTYVMVKPDGVERGLIGEIVTRIEKKGLKIVAGKLMQIDRELAEKHYAEHIGKSFFRGFNWIYYFRAGVCDGARRRRCDCNGTSDDGENKSVRS